MLFDPLDRVLGSVTKVRLLRVLLRLTEPLSGREAQARAGVASRSSASAALSELSELGIVMRTEIRGSNLYAVNPDHHLTAALRELFVREEGRMQAFAAAMQEALARAEVTGHVSSVILYGSNARREAVPQSDVDLLVVVKDGHEAEVKDALYEATPAMRSRHGLRISPYVLSESRAAERVRTGDPFIRAVQQDGRVLLGKPLDGMATPW